MSKKEDMSAKESRRTSDRIVADRDKLDQMIRSFDEDRKKTLCDLIIKLIKKNNGYNNQKSKYNLIIYTNPKRVIKKKFLDNSYVIGDFLIDGYIKEKFNNLFFSFGLIPRLLSWSNQGMIRLTDDETKSLKSIKRFIDSEFEYVHAYSYESSQYNDLDENIGYGMSFYEYFIKAIDLYQPELIGHNFFAHVIQVIHLECNSVKTSSKLGIDPTNYRKVYLPIRKAIGSIDESNTSEVLKAISSNLDIDNASASIALYNYMSLNNLARNTETIHESGDDQDKPITQLVSDFDMIDEVEQLVSSDRGFALDQNKLKSQIERFEEVIGDDLLGYVYTSERVTYTGLGAKSKVSMMTTKNRLTSSVIKLISNRLFVN